MHPWTIPTLLVSSALLTGCASGHDHSDEVSAWLEANEELNTPVGKDDGRSCSGVRVPDFGPFDGRVALTFDDGPNPVTTPKVIETLRRHNAPATFFINGNRVTNATTRAIVRDIVDDPLFTLANHTWSHPNMRNLSLSSAASQIDRTTEVIEEAGGTPLYMRFPFGSSNCDTMELVHDRGQISVGWHIDSADWCFASGGGFCKESTFPDPGLTGFRDSMSDYIMHQVDKERLKGGVLLFHDIHASTERDLEGILETLEARDYRFVHLDEENFPVLHGAPPPPRKFIGDACDEHDDCNFEGGICASGLCTKACVRSCPDRDGYATTRCVGDADARGNLCALSCAVSICDQGLCTSDVQGPTGTWSVCR